jgi:hypothetical protein
MKTIYNKNGYCAQVKDGVCVVHRGQIVFGDLDKPQKMTSHVGEKLPSQDWWEVRLSGCPDNIRQEIIEAWKLDQIQK